MTLPAWRTAMAAYEVIALPASNTLADLNPKNNASLNPNYPGNPEWWGGTGFTAVIGTWCGAACDTDHDEVWWADEGGHGDYGGNEVMKLALNQATPAYALVRAPSGAIGNLLTTNDGQESTGVYSDGRTRSTHTYNKHVYVPGVGPMKGVQGKCYQSAASGTAKPILYNRSTGEPTLLTNAHPDGLAVESGEAAAFDPTRGTQGSIWVRYPGTAKFARYDVAAGTWTSVGSSTAPGPGEVSMCCHPDGAYALLAKNPYPISGAPSSAATFKVVDLSNGTIYAPTFSGSVAGNLRRGFTQWRWVPSLGVFAGWDNSTDTNTVTFLTPGADPFTDTWTISTQAFTGDTVSARASNGTFGRWCYFPNLDGFFVVNSVSEAGYFFALS